MVHLSDLDWKRPGEQVIEEFKKGDKVKAQVLDVDVEKERISLGIKQLEGDPMATAGELKKGDVVTCEVIDVKEAGIDVKIVGTDLTVLHQAHRARPRPQRPALRALPGRPEGRCPRHPVRPPHPQGRGLDQGAGSGRGEGGDRPVRLLRFRRDARRHPRHRAQAQGRGSRQGIGPVSGDLESARRRPPGSRDPGVHLLAAIVRPGRDGVPGARGGARAPPERRGGVC